MSSTEAEAPLDSLLNEPQTDWRDRALADPELILEDRDLMRALIAANDGPFDPVQMPQHLCRIAWISVRKCLPDRG